MSPGSDRRGVLVVSLDFELHWGLVDMLPPDGGPYRSNLLGVRDAVPQMLDLFSKFDISATWATVGMLFARDRAERLRFDPPLKPTYQDASFSSYCVHTGEDESNDPLHYGSSLIDLIRATGKQEISTHTYSHYYCQEPGQTKEQFRADLESARCIAHEYGVTLKSIVYPRNQYNAAYTACLNDLGIVAYRGNQRGAIYKEGSTHATSSRLHSLGRLLDAYVPLTGDNTVGWDELRVGPQIVNIAASQFLRPYTPHLAPLDRLKQQRIVASMKHAAVSGRIYHLWWHPHNFGKYPSENIAFLREVILQFCELRNRFGMRSMTMAELAEEVLDEK